nr:orcokinin analog [Carcinus maenas]
NFDEIDRSSFGFN